MEVVILSQAVSQRPDPWSVKMLPNACQQLSEIISGQK